MTTYAGKLKQLDNQWRELKETLGAYVVPALKDVIAQSVNGIHALQGLFGADDVAWKKKEIELLTKSIERLQKTAKAEGALGEDPYLGSNAQAMMNQVLVLSPLRKV